MARNMSRTVEKYPEKMELKKHVAVIHSSNKLSLLQRKIANALLFNAYPNLQYKDEHVIHIATLCEIIGYDSNDYKTIKRSLVGLLSTVLQWNLVDGDKLDKEGIWNASSIIADASINGAICTYSYSNKMRNLLYRPNIYGRLDMNIQARFKSGYGLALYENCNRFQDIGQTPWFDIEKFRLLMGIEKGKYKQFKDFKTRVLDKALEEVNEYADFNIEPQLRRQNRQVVSIQFLIKRGKRALDTVETSTEINLQDRLMNAFGFSVRQVSNVRAKYEDDYLLEKMTMIEGSPSYQNGKIKHLARYLMKALLDDFQPVKKALVKPRTAVKSVETRKKREPKALNLDELTEFTRFQNKWLIERVNEITSAAKAKLLKEFEKMLPGIYKDVYAREGLKNILIQDKLCEYLKVKLHPLTQDLPKVAQWRVVQKIA